MELIMSKYEYNVSQQGQSYFLVSLKTVGLMMFITLIALGVLAALITFGPVSESAAEPCVITATVIGVFFSGLYASKRLRTKGWLAGFTSGLVYFLIASLLGALIFDSWSIGKDTVKMLMICLCSGVTGGVFGVNIFKKRR